MFTGIIKGLGTIKEISHKKNLIVLKVDTKKLFRQIGIGDSIAVNGVCLTVIKNSATEFTADVSGETLSRTTWGRRRAGDAVNLETALTLSTPLGGHLVSGHVDGVGTVVDRREQGRSEQFRIKVPDGLSRYIAEKGSICVDGVSLTVNTVQAAEFTVNIIPHSFVETTLSSLQDGSEVNLEVDILARYLERLMLGEDATRSGSNITREFLTAHGFIK